MILSSSRRKQARSSSSRLRVEELENRVVLAVNPFQQAFDINPAESQFTLGVDFYLHIPNENPIFLGSLLEQSTGSLTADIAGRLLLGSSDGTTLTIDGGSQIDPIEQAGPFDPGNAPADLAGTVLLLGFIDLDAAIRNMLAEVGPVSTTLAVDNTFTASDIPLSITAATLDYAINGSADTTDFSGTTTTYTAAGSLDVSGGDVESISIPISAVASSFTDIEGLTIELVISFTGTMVAYASTDPGVGIDGPTSAVQGEPLTYTFSAFDDSWGTSSSFTYDIDWDGDDVVDQTIVGGDSIQVEHVYSTTGNYQIKATITDASSATGSRPPYAVTVEQYQLRPNGGNTDLVWGGDAAGQAIVFYAAGGNLAVRDTSWNLLADEFSGITGDVVFYGQGGDDTVYTGNVSNMRAYLAGGDDTLQAFFTSGGNFYISGGAGDDSVLFMTPTNMTIEFDAGQGDNSFGVASATGGIFTYVGGDDYDEIILLGGSGFTLDAELGDGDDFILNVADSSDTTILAGGGNDIIISAAEGTNSIDGGAGDDLIVGGLEFSTTNNTIVGGSGNDVLMGGGGASSLSGGAGEDLVIAGSLSLDLFGEEELPGIMQVWLQWLEPDPIQTRVDYLTGVLTGGWIDPAYVLVAGTTVLDNGAVDVALGDGDADFLLYDVGTDSSDYLGGTDLRIDL